MTKPDMGQLKLRIPYKLRYCLEKVIDESGRSLNSEIVWRLQKSLDAPDLAKQVEELKARVAELEGKR